MTAQHPIKPTSPRWPSAWQPNLRRRSTYRRGKSVQTTGTSSIASGSPISEQLSNNRGWPGILGQVQEEHRSTFVQVDTCAGRIVPTGHDGGAGQPTLGRSGLPDLSSPEASQSGWSAESRSQGAQWPRIRWPRPNSSMNQTLAVRAGQLPVQRLSEPTVWPTRLWPL